MIKVLSNYALKVPGEQDYSSKSFMASVEVELPSGLSGHEIQDKIHETFNIVRQSVEDEIGGQATHSRGSDERATNKQVQFIISLGKNQSLGLPELNRQVADLYGAGNVYDLSKQDASKFVDVLKQAA